MTTNRTTLQPEQAKKLLATCATDSPIDLRDRALIVVGLETGMRRMSLVGMALEAIDTDRLDQARDHCFAHVPIKGANELYPVPLSKAAQAALEPWRRWLRSQKVTSGPVFRSLTKGIARGGKLSFTVGPGLALVSIYKIVAHRAEQAKLDGVHPDLFRDTFVAWRTQQGLSEIEVAAITGQSIRVCGGHRMSLGGSGTAAEACESTPVWLSDLCRTPRVPSRSRLKP